MAKIMERKSLMPVTDQNTMSLWSNGYLGTRVTILR